MTSNVKVPWPASLSEIGAYEIASRLASFSVVNPCKKDIGIDFFCELIENESPSIPFYVQAKSTEHFDNKWGVSIKKATIVYWLLRQFPVFLVAYDDKAANCYWMAIEDLRYDLFQKMYETNSETIYLKMDTSHILESGKNRNMEFVKKIKDSLASIELFWGQPSFKGDGYEKLVPDSPRSPVELKRTKESLRAILYSLIIYYFFQRGDLENAYLLGDFLTKFDKWHYNHFVWFGQINKALGRTKEAKANFENALRICESDPKYNRESMKGIIARIKRDIEDCG